MYASEVKPTAFLYHQQRNTIYHFAKTANLTTRDGYLVVVMIGSTIHAISRQQEVGQDIAKKLSRKDSKVTLKWVKVSSAIELLNKEIANLESADYGGGRLYTLKVTLDLFNN